MIELREYQKRAVKRLHQSVEDGIRSSENEVIVFKSPTGSGKTVMVSEMLKRLVRNKENNNKYAFVWIAVRKLHEQSKEKLEQYYEDDRLIRCSYFEDLEDKEIKENEILFINWHSINKKDINIYVRENEEDNNLNAVIQNTKDEGRHIILIIDESHHTAKSDKSIGIIMDTLVPKVTVEVSATPHLKDNISGWVKVNLADVKEEEMIKSEISVNPEFMDVTLGAKDSDTLVIEQSLKKREELKKLYKKEGTNINPLVLVQLPDKKGKLLGKKDQIIKILRSKNITEKNGKLAIWLSEEKTDNLANIVKEDNEVEVLIFKQAIALGWDCPRASILDIFRDSKSFEFTIQTIGRIMRMPELKYYLSEELNKGFIFTNLPNIQITEDYAKDYVTVFESKRNAKLYSKIGIPAIYLKRQRERTRLSGEFVRIFMEVTKQVNLKKKITLKPSRIVSPIISDGKIDDIDKTGEIDHKGQIQVKLNEVEIQQLFDKFIYAICSPYAPIDSSDRMKTAIYNFFEKEFKIKKFDPEVQKLVMGKENIKLFVEAITISKDRYTTEVVEKLSEKKDKQTTPKWEVPPIDSYKSNAQKEVHPKSIMQPFFFTTKSKQEDIFMSLLDSSDKVTWWYKNREGEKKYFAIAYTDDSGLEWAFYVDFIIQFKNGNIGLFDTKMGFTAKEAVNKAEALHRYIKKNKNKKLIGGIATYDKGVWRYNDNEKYTYDPKNLSGWKILDI